MHAHGETTQGVCPGVAGHIGSIASFDAAGRSAEPLDGDDRVAGIDRDRSEAIAGVNIVGRMVGAEHRPVAVNSPHDQRIGADAGDGRPSRDFYHGLVGSVSFAEKQRLAGVVEFDATRRDPFRP